MMLQLIGENFSRRHVVAITKAARHDEYLILIEHRGIFNHSVYMYPLGLCAGHLKRILRFHITVDARRTEHYCLNLTH